MHNFAQSAPTAQFLASQRARRRRKPAALLLAGLLTAGFVPSEADAAEDKVERPTVDGGLDKPAVRAVVRANIGDVRSCYNAELRDDGDLAGRSVLTFVVQTDGSVSEVGVSESTMPARFDQCLSQAASTWSFPVANADTQVSYPFMMSPG